MLAAVSLPVPRPALLPPRLIPPPHLVPAACPRRARPVPTLSQSTAPGIDDSDDDSNGDDNEFLDASDPECTLDEGNGNGGKSVKAKGKRKATTQGGKNPKQARCDQ
jgi:hypothetical protein